MLRGLVADACLARKKNQAFWMCALPLRMKVILCRDFPFTSGDVDMTLSPTLVSDIVVVGIVRFTRFQLCQRPLTKLHVKSEKLRLCLK